MRKLLSNELHCSEEKLNILGRQPLPPILVVARDYQQMKRHLAEAQDSLQPNYRRLTERMSQEILNAGIVPLGLVDSYEANEVLSKNIKCRKLSKTQKEDHLLDLEIQTIGEKNRPVLSTPQAEKKIAIVD